jgi:transglutaminase-like putative cysteine protease
MTDSKQPIAWRHVCYLLLSLSMVTIPHVLYLPWWIIAVTVTLIGWRAYLGYARYALPGRWMLMLVAGAATIGVFISYRTIFGREAGIALLVIMLGLKFLETRTLRDAVLLIYLGYFLVITNFLRDQTIPVALYMLACTVVITATMISLHHAATEPAFRVQLRKAGVLLAQSVPLMLVLFLLFPRVPGPLWGLPQDTRSGVSGLSDTMTPGSLSRLTLSDEVAFRVKFEGDMPRRRHLYWRGPVMWDFDGRTWTVPRFLYNVPKVRVSGEPLDYEVTLEPHNRRWLFALDIPGKVPPLSLMGGDFQIYSNEPVKNRMRYEMTSYLNATYGATENRYALRRALQLPANSNPRAAEHARSLREKHGDADQPLVEEVLRMFRDQPFFYTLEPPPLGEHPVDEFLFTTRSGFCEHYASAFAVLMRAAGIPARIVTGYHGGDLNEFGNYVIVRQAEAHAWAEIWLKDRGWVRIDPTSAVSPLRVDQGISAAVKGSESLPMMVRGDFETLRRLRLSWDYVANSWNQWVLGYTPERQRWLLSRVGMDNATWERLTALLFLLCGVIVAGFTVLALRQLKRRVSDPVKTAYLRFCDKLRRKGLPRDPAEGPLDYARRIGRARPDLQPTVAAITALYVTLRYGTGVSMGALDELRRRVARFKA